MVWLSALAFAVQEPPAPDDAGWAVVARRKTDQGVVIVRRQRVGEVQCLEGRLDTKLPPEVLHEVVVDIDAAGDWSEEKLLMSKMLARETGYLDYIQMVDVPMIADRYWVLRGTPDEGPDGTRRLAWTRLAAAVAYPAAQREALRISPRAVEVEINYGEWRMVPDGGRTGVRYAVCSDPGGTVPDWIANSAATSAVPKTVASMVKEAGKRHGVHTVAPTRTPRRDRRAAAPSPASRRSGA